MLFASFLGTIESIARLGDRATAGAIRGMNSHLSLGQVKRILLQLEREGYVHYYSVPHGRTGKNVYYLSNLCITNVLITARAADQAVDPAEMSVAS